MHAIGTDFLLILRIFINFFFFFNTSLEIFQKLDPHTVTAKSSFEEAFLGLQKLLAAVNDILEGIRR